MEEIQNKKNKSSIIKRKEKSRKTITNNKKVNCIPV
jgi:hypothetical protein